jgi:hypothetical protein
MAFANPFSHPLHRFALEIVVLACFALTLRHAAIRYRAGERRYLFQLVAIVVYGITMELIAFNYIQSYEHATFTVELYRGLLPLYVTFVYVVIHYTGLVLVQRLGLRWFPEAVVAGLAMALLDLPFDITGVDAKWWSWSSADPNNAVRWFGVPVTSFEWYLLFGGALAALCRALRARVERWHAATWLALAPAVAIGIIVVGTIAFLPFHAFVALGASPGAVVAAHAAIALVVAIVARRSATPAPTEAISVVALMYGFHAARLPWARRLRREHPPLPAARVTSSSEG